MDLAASLSPCTTFKKADLRTACSRSAQSRAALHRARNTYGFGVTLSDSLLAFFGTSFRARTRLHSIHVCKKLGLGIEIHGVSHSTFISDETFYDLLLRSVRCEMVAARIFIDLLERVQDVEYRLQCLQT